MDGLAMTTEIERIYATSDAYVKAHNLLLEHLNAAQRYDWLTYEFFMVKAFWRLRTRYFVVTGGLGINEVNSRGEVWRSYGIKPAASTFMPMPDIALAQKLMLETKPSLLRKACRIARYPPYPISLYPTHSAPLQHPIAARYHRMKYQ